MFNDIVILISNFTFNFDLRSYQFLINNLVYT